jgi:PAP2 superfamily
LKRIRRNQAREDSTQSLEASQIGSRWARAAALAMVVAVAGAVTLSRGFSQQIAHDIFFSLTLAGCTIVFLSVRPLREFPQVVAAGLFLGGLQMLVLKTPANVLPAFAYLGLGSLFVLAVKRVLARGEDRRLLQDATVPPLLFLILGYLGSAPLAMTGWLHPQTLDWFLYSFDQSLGVPLSFKLGQVVLASRLLTRVVLDAYYVLPLVIMFTYARQLVRNRNLAMTAFLAFVVAGPLGVVFYNLIPAGGPLNLFGSRFPFDPMTTEQVRQLPLHALAIGGPRNAFPSLHLAWALLICWYSDGLSRWTKVVFFVFLVGTVISTLALGEHYFVDLVTAFPFALMIQAACALNVPISNARRFVPLVSGALLMLGWMILLRWGLPVVWISPVVPWFLVAGTIFLTLVLQARLRPELPPSAN